MDILYLLVPLSVLLVFLIGALFWWAVHSGQFDDLEGPAHRILMDDDSPQMGRQAIFRAISRSPVRCSSDRPGNRVPPDIDSR
ncbi:MAG: cbb3-type cytochrome oxidase assembly protein CcoS [Burkholderiales bacterium]|nr:cbb3-type cytochrome oxidase assembly protein CcoS [Burkholderiales bacterium]